MGRKACVYNLPTLHESIHIIWALLQESPQIAQYPKCTTHLVSFSYLLGFVEHVSFYCVIYWSQSPPLPWGKEPGEHKHYLAAQCENDNDKN